MLAKLTTQYFGVPNQRYGNAEFAGSGDCSLHLYCGSVITAHSVNGNSHKLSPGLYVIGNTVVFLKVFCLDNFPSLIRAAGRTRAMRKLWRLALGTV
jgi:hypothetical protein